MNEIEKNNYQATCRSCKKTEDVKLACVCMKVNYCSKQCQRDDWKSHKHSCVTFTVGSVDGKGRGMFATRNLAPGSVVLVEKPVLSVDVKKKNDKKQQKILQDFKKLPEDVQTEVLKLHDPEESSSTSTPALLLSKLLRIMNYNSVNTNNFVLKTNMQTLYLKNSLFNHSCKPNCCWVPDEKSDILTVRALVPVRKGQELTVNYFFCLQEDRGQHCLMKEERQAKIMKSFNFLCLCNTCNKNDDDDLRREYIEIDKQVEAGFSDLESTLDVLNKCERKLKIGRKIDPQVLLRDLIDSIIVVKCLMDHGFDLEDKCKELRSEFEKISCCYNTTFINKMKNELMLH